MQKNSKSAKKVNFAKNASEAKNAKRKGRND